MKVKSTRKYIIKKYSFLDENDKEINVEFKFYGMSASQQEKLAKSGDRANEVVKEIMKENLLGDEPYKTALIDYLMEEGNIYEEYTELSETLGKQNKKK